MTDCGSETTTSMIVVELAGLNAWNAAMTRLLEWRRDPGQLMDEDVLPPKRGIIDAAYSLALKMRDMRLPGPLRVLPDGEGGIVFERQSGSSFETIGIEATGRIEIVSFEGSRVRSRMLLTPGMQQEGPAHAYSERCHTVLLSESVSF